MKTNLIMTFAVLVLASCGAKQTTTAARVKSDNTASQTPAIDTSAYANSTWRLTAAYPESVIGSNGQESGNTSTIAKGQNAVASYPGQVPCDLVVKNSNPDYNALMLPGNDGQTFNPCELISAMLRAYPYEGKATVTKTNPRGGQNTVYYDAKGNIMGYKFVGTEAGTITLSINDTLKGSSQPQGQNQASNP